MPHRCRWLRHKVKRDEFKVIIHKHAFGLRISAEGSPTTRRHAQLDSLRSVKRNMCSLWIWRMSECTSVLVCTFQTAIKGMIPILHLITSWSTITIYEQRKAEAFLLLGMGCEI